MSVIEGAKKLLEDAGKPLGVAVLSLASLASCASRTVFNLTTVDQNTGETTGGMIYTTSVNNRKQEVAQITQQIMGSAIQETIISINFLESLDKNSALYKQSQDQLDGLYAQGARLQSMCIRSGKNDITQEEVKIAGDLTTFMRSTTDRWIKSTKEYEGRNLQDVRRELSQRPFDGGRALPEKPLNIDSLLEAKAVIQLYASTLEFLVKQSRSEKTWEMLKQNELGFAEARLGLINLNITQLRAGKTPDNSSFLSDIAMGEATRPLLAKSLANMFPEIDKVYKLYSPEVLSVLRGKNRQDASAYATFKSLLSSEFQALPSGLQAHAWLAFREIPKETFSGKETICALIAQTSMDQALLDDLAKQN